MKAWASFQQDAAAGAVVDCAVVNIVAAHGGIDSQMIVMCGVRHGLSGSTALSTRQNAQYIVRIEFSHFADNMRLEAHRQLARLEFARSRQRHHVLQLQARRLEDAPCRVELNPRGSLELGVMVVAQVHLLVAPGAAHDLPRVTGEVGAMNDERAHGAHARGLPRTCTSNGRSRSWYRP